MQISDTEVKKILAAKSVVQAIIEIGEEHDRVADAELVHNVTTDVMAMSDREDRIAELKAKIEAGEYNPSADDIANAMIRRSIADSVR